MKRLLAVAAIAFVAAAAASGQETKSPYQGYFDRAMQYYREKDLERAIREMGKVLSSRDPGELAPAYYARGVFHREKGDLPAAAADLEKSLQYRKDWLPPLEVLGPMLGLDADASVRMQKGLRYLRAAAQQQSTSAAVYQTLSRLLVEGNRLAEAVHYLDVALHFGADVFSLLESDAVLGALRDTEHGRRLLEHRAGYLAARETFAGAVEAINGSAYAQAVALLDRCIPALLDAVGPTGFTLEQAYFHLGLSYALLGTHEAAIGPYERALRIRVQTRGASSLEAADLHESVAAAHANGGETRKALARYAEALAIKERVLGEHDARTALTIESMGILHARLGGHAEALACHERALAIRTKVLGDSHPDTLTSMEKIAGVLSERGEHEKAIALGQKALDLRVAKQGRDTSAVADSSEALAMVVLRKGDYPRAVLLFTTAIAVRRKLLGDYHEDTARAFEGHAVASKALKRFAEARESYTRAYTIRLKVLGPRDKATLATEEQIGILYAAERKDWLVPFLESILRAKATALGDDHPSMATDYDRLGREHVSRGEREKAITAFAKALAIRLASPDSAGTDLVDSHLRLGDAQRDALDHDDAVASYRGALSASERATGGGDLLAATCHARLGEAYGLKGAFDEAIAHFEKAYQLSAGIRGEHHPEMAPLCDALGRACQDKGLFGTALAWYTRGLSIRLATFGDRDARTAESRRMIGALRLAMGDLEEAEEQLRRALSVQEALLGRDHLDTAATGCGLADVLVARGDAEGAIAAYTRSLEAYRKAKGERDPQVAAIYGYLAAAYGLGGQLDTALAYSKRALAIDQAVFGEASRHTSVAYNNLATIHWRRREYESAIECFEKAIVGLLGTVGENHPDTAHLYGNIALVLAAGGAYTEALRHGETALRIGKAVFGAGHPAVAGFSNTLGLVSYQAGDLHGSISRIEDSLAMARAAGIRTRIVEYAGNLGWAYRDARDAVRARACFDEAIAAVEAACGELGSGKTEFMARNISSYYSSLALSADLGDVPSFFRTAESLRARGFLDRLSLAAALSAAGVGAAQAAELVALSDEIANLASRRNAEVQKPEKARDRAALLEVSRQLEEKEKRFAAIEGSLLANERFRQLRRPRIAEIAEAQALLGDATAILEYVIWEERDRESLVFGQKRSFCLVIRKGGARIVPLDGQFDYGAAVEQFRAAIINAPDRAAGPASALYAALIGPVEAELQGCRELIIVPDGPLAFLPFDALRETPKAPYLAERWSITLSPSVSVMLMLGARAPGGDRRRMLAFGGAVYSAEGEGTDRGRGGPGTTERELTATAREHAAKRAGKDGAARYFGSLGFEWANLPGTMQEVEEIGARVFGGTGVTLHTGRDATERRLKDLSAAGELARYRLVHLACHGYYDQVYPSFSSVVFSEVSGLVDGGEDGYLTVEEVAGLDLRADLVNLSACETGLGRTVAGDGVTGLARAFQVAGADRVGVTLWEVADDATRQFMIDVYRKYAAGIPLRDAFAETKRAFIRSADYDDPYYWSPFVLYGS